MELSSIQGLHGSVNVLDSAISNSSSALGISHSESSCGLNTSEYSQQAGIEAQGWSERQ